MDAIFAASHGDAAAKENGAAAPRRDEALAFIIECLVRRGNSPSYQDIARRLEVSLTRAKQLVRQLVDAGIIDKTSGGQRNLRVRDVAAARAICDERLRELGWVAADPLGSLEGHCPQWQLPALPEIGQLPNVE